MFLKNRGKLENRLNRTNHQKIYVLKQKKNVKKKHYETKRDLDQRYKAPVGSQGFSFVLQK